MPGLVQTGPAWKGKFVFVAPGRVAVAPTEKRKYGTHNAQGKRYEPCPMPTALCGAMAMVREEIFDSAGTVIDIVWECENCGYKDSREFGPLN